MNSQLLLTLNSSQMNDIIFKEYKKNEIIFHEGDLCHSIGIVIDGQVDIVSYSFNGDELIYNSLEPNMIFGNNLIFSTQPEYKGSVIAKQKSNIAIIEKNKLIELLQTNKKFLEEYLKIQSDFGKHLNAQIKLLSYASSEERFMYYLWINNDVINYISITDLANKLHMKRETLSRLISDLEKRHLIRRLNKQIVSTN